MRIWHDEQECDCVAMASTGIYWQPVYAVLETALLDKMHLLVVNARSIKNVPGKQTNMRDAEWIATLLRAELLKGSFAPKRDIRDLRLYTRFRKVLIRDITSQKNRGEKLLQSSSFRLSSFLFDIFGSSGLAIMGQLVQVGFISSGSLDLCLKRRVSQRAGEILSSLYGGLSVPQRKLIQMVHLTDLQANLRGVEEEIHNSFSQCQGPIEMLDSIPRIDLTAAYAILAEIGHEISAFPTAQHLALGRAWPRETTKAPTSRRNNALHQAITTSKRSCARSLGSSLLTRNSVYLPGTGGSSNVPMPNGPSLPWLVNFW